jgi:hypothetical protein
MCTACWGAKHSVLGQGLRVESVPREWTVYSEKLSVVCGTYNSTRREHEDFISFILGNTWAAQQKYSEDRSAAC